MDILLDLENPRWPPAVEGPKSAKFDPTNHNFARHLDQVHLIWTMEILLDPRNKPADFLSFFSKSKMVAGCQKLNFDII